jgi:hypothetical protein
MQEMRTRWKHVRDLRKNKTVISVRTSVCIAPIDSHAIFFIQIFRASTPFRRRKRHSAPLARPANHGILGVVRRSLAVDRKCICFDEMPRVTVLC